MIFEININNCTLDMYDKYLSYHKNWININRDIKLTYLLENKRVEYTIDKINIIGYFEDVDYTLMSRASFVVKKLIFITKGNLIEKLKIDIIILETSAGERLKTLIDAGVKLNIIQHFGNVLHYYIEVPKIKNQSF